MLKKPGFAPLNHWSLVAFLLPLYLYLATLAPSVTTADSGQLMTAVWYLGSTSPPSHPLFYLYLKPFTWLPIGSFAFRINLAGAVTASLACLACYHIVVLFLHRYSTVEGKQLNLFIIHVAGLVSGLLLAVSPGLWLSVNQGGYEPLLLLLTSVALFALLKQSQQSESDTDIPFYWYMSAFCCGLAFAVDRFAILLLPGMLLFVLVQKPTILRNYKQILLVVACLLAGFSFYLYLPLRAAMNAGQLWYEFPGFANLFKSLFYAGELPIAATRNASLLLRQLLGFNIVHQLGWAGLVLFFFGIWFCIKIERRFLIIFLVTLFIYWLAVAVYLNPAAEAIAQTGRLYAPLYLFAAVMVGLGIFELLVLLSARTGFNAISGLKFNLPVLLLLLMLPLGRFYFGLSTADQHDNYLAHDYGVNALRNLPENSLFFTAADAAAFPLWYLQTVEKIRPDVDLVHIPLLVSSWHREQLLRLKPYLDAGPTLAVPAETVFRSLLVYLVNERPLLVDFSARQQHRWLEEHLQQQGLLFAVSASDMLAAKDMAQVWELYNITRLIPKQWQADEQTRKLLITYAWCMMQAAEELARRGHVTSAQKLFQQTAVIMPSWSDDLQKLAKRYGMQKKETDKP